MFLNCVNPLSGKVVFRDSWSKSKFQLSDAVSTAVSTAVNRFHREERG